MFGAYRASAEELFEEKRRRPFVFLFFAFSDFVYVLEHLRIFAIRLGAYRPHVARDADVVAYCGAVSQVQDIGN